MSNWRDLILKDLIPGISNLTLVADPDNLLTEEIMSKNLHDRGFHLIEYTNPIEFRYTYESQYRNSRNQIECAELLVILNSKDADLEVLPFDLLYSGRQLTYSLGEIFPNFSYPVIEKLDRSLLDNLFAAQQLSIPDRMGDNASKDFVLLHVFGVTAELIVSEVDLLRALLRLHYGTTQVPQILAERFVQILNSKKRFPTWPIETLILNDQSFYAFLQERWPIFLNKISKSDLAKEDTPQFGLKYPGKEFLPFDHQDIKVYIDNLFIEGKLTPVQGSGIKVESGSWIQCGIIAKDKEDEKERIIRMFELVEKEQPGEQARYTDWTAFAQKWAKLSSLVQYWNNTKYLSKLRDVGDTLNEAFTKWLTENFSSLINLPPTNPAMLHQVPRRLARDLEQSNESRIALIVIDGLSLNQWITICRILKKQDKDLVMNEYATFAWIPTLTSVSRQSIFAGKAPIYFSSSINSTNNEEKLWKQFWEDQGLSRIDVAYKRSLGDGDASTVLDTIINPGNTKVVGLVVDKVDKIMHGMQLGTIGMQNQIEQWCQEGYLITLLNKLMLRGFDIWLTSDHGNIECEGKGRPSEGVIAETRGERARVYPTPELRSNVSSKYPFAENWPNVGLPENFFPLVIKDRSAFVHEGTITVGHGGITIEEVIVPLVKIGKRV